MCSARKRIRCSGGLAIALPKRLLLILTLLPPSRQLIAAVAPGRPAGSRQGRGGTEDDDCMGDSSSHKNGGSEEACAEREKEMERDGDMDGASDGG